MWPKSVTVWERSLPKPLDSHVKHYVAFGYRVGFFPNVAVLLPSCFGRRAAREEPFHPLPKAAEAERAWLELPEEKIFPFLGINQPRQSF